MDKSNKTLDEESKLKLLKDHIAEFPDFPQKSILFR